MTVGAWLACALFAAGVVVFWVACKLLDKREQRERGPK